jgi:hypothetical protein
MRKLDVLINDINWLISAWNWYVSACGAAGEVAAAAGAADSGAAEAASTVVSAISQIRGRRVTNGAGTAENSTTVTGDRSTVVVTRGAGMLE